MSREAGCRRNSILVDDSERPEFRELRIVIICKRKGMKRFQPSMVCFSSLSRLVNLVFQRRTHRCSRSNQSGSEFFKRGGKN